MDEGAEVPLSIEDTAPQAETEQVRAPFHKQVVLEAQKSVPSESGAIKRGLAEIDRQTIESLSQYSPPDRPNVAFPYTKVDVSLVADKIKGSESPASEPKTPRKKLTYVILGGAARFPDGNPFTPQDITYDRVMSSLARVTNEGVDGATDVEVYTVGYPEALWGKVDDAWVKDFDEKGFQVYGEALSGFFGDVVNTPETDRIIVQGMSMGAVIAQETIKKLPAEIKTKVQAIYDNPAGLDNGTIKGLQIPAGFVADGLLQLVNSDVQRGVFLDKSGLLQTIAQKAKERGIEPGDSEKDVKLKKKAFNMSVLKLIQGTPFEDTDVRTMLRSGIGDPTSFSMAEFARTIKRVVLERKEPFFQKSRRSLMVSVASTHAIDRTRVEKWARMVKFLQNATVLSQSLQQPQEAS